MTPRLFTPIRRFLTDTRAAVAFETVIIAPLLIWAFVASFVFFDAYRVYNTSVKATYSIADILSRQTNRIYGYDIDGLARVLDHMVHPTRDSQLRVTQVFWNGTEYRVDWSFATGGRARLFNASMAALEDQLPDLAVSERLLLVESFVTYDPAFDAGLSQMTFENFTFTRPRYANFVDFDDSTTLPSS